MTLQESKTLDGILDGLMRRYLERVPEVEQVRKLLVQDGFIAHESNIENDHIAFRTMGVPHLGIGSLERIWLHHGYERRDHYYFDVKKLDAYWYSPPEPRYPRIFISELRVQDLSERAQRIIRKYTDTVTGDPVARLDLDDAAQVDDFLHRPLWELPTWEEYETLQEESEYAAWVIYNRYYLNHFTVSVHNLPTPIDTIPGFNEYVEGNGIALNDAGGKVKTSPDGLLRQSSTVSSLIPAQFADGSTHQISGSYVEFAERRPLPQYAELPKAELRREHRRDGFEAGNADKIFESTYSTQTTRKAR